MSLKITRSSEKSLGVVPLGASPKCDRHAGKRVDQPVLYITERYCSAI